ncbi:6-phosphofructokinase [Balneatrix alpica]|uniref:ATP-dependent 6-phosphofructokinase n=1 Tax=Balneatrix alpica TaxID=75684 RepID=A0ABV5ZHW2_9GAMM|nr:6-phosphofructokinase [Balneatrix alpica]
MWRLQALAQNTNLQRIAVLTSGGDAPGMNAAVRAVTRTALAAGVEVIGIQHGYIGLFEREALSLDMASVGNIIQRGGTLLKTGRCEDFRHPAGRAQAAEYLRELGVDALVVIGGDGSLTGAHLLAQEQGIKVIGLPGTIDNDIWGTEDTIGFDTAVNTALEAIDRIRDTADALDRLFLVEVMGRNTGFIAVQVALAGGAEGVISPEQPLDYADLVARLAASRQRGKRSSILVVAEGPKEGNSYQLAERLAGSGYPSRVCVLGHIQRGGRPTGHDRVLASMLGEQAVRYLLAGHDRIMLGVRDNQVVVVPLQELATKRKTLDVRYLEMVKTLAG